MFCLLYQHGMFHVVKESQDSNYIDQTPWFLSDNKKFSAISIKTLQSLPEFIHDGLLHAHENVLVPVEVN